MSINVINYSEDDSNLIIEMHNYARGILSVGQGTASGEFSAYKVIRNKFIEYSYGAELPVYVYGSIKKRSMNNFYRYPKKIIRYFTYSRSHNYVSLGKPFERLFRTNLNLNKIVLRDGNTYYVAKGTILLEDFTPIIQITHKYLSDEDVVSGPMGYNTVLLEPEKMKIYINRLIYTEDFMKDHKSLYNKIHRYFLPKLVYLKCPMVYFRKLNLWSEYNISEERNPVARLLDGSRDDIIIEDVMQRLPSNLD